MPAKLTRAQIQSLCRLRESLVDVIAYLKRDDTVVCIPSQGSSTLDYQAKGTPEVRQQLRACPHDYLYPVAKDIGSPLARLPDALKEVDYLLNPQARPENQTTISDA